VRTPVPRRDPGIQRANRRVKRTERFLDMLSNALREYRTVSADSSSAASAAPSPGSTHPGQFRLPLDVRRLSWIRKLAGDYAFNFPSIGALYAGDPASDTAWGDAIRRAQEYPRRAGEMAAVLAAQQARRNAPAEARAAAAKLGSTTTVAVVTGQQATVFGGPLYTLLKAITAIQLARQKSREHQADVVPVFWVHAEDHDWDEVASCTVLDSSFEPRTVTLQRPPGAGDKPVFQLPLDDSIEQTIGSLFEFLPVTDFTNWVRSAIGAAYTPGMGTAEAFARWIEGLLGPYGLVVFESSDPAAKPLASDIFVRELETAGRTPGLATRAGEQLAASGHAPQVVPQLDSVSLFHMNGARLPIKRQGDGFAIGDAVVRASDLLEEARTFPERFSPNVLLRAVVQDRLFPTIAYVPGPSELAYLGQLRGVYDHFGVPMPLLYPRATATIIDSGAARFLHRYEMPIEALQPQDESALNRLLASQLPKPVEQAMQDAEQVLHRSMERVIDALPAVDPTLAGAGKTTLGKMEHELRALQQKIIHAAKRRDETMRRQFTRAHNQIFPHGDPQERMLAVVFFLNRYGPAVIDRLIDDLPIDLGYHWVLTI
jgi:bacillithiol biosynthesis cysteine-adding enzyme BshC